MPEFLLFCAVSGLALWLFLMRGEVAYLKRRIATLEDALLWRDSPARAEPADTGPADTTPTDTAPTDTGEVAPARPEPVEPFRVAAKTTGRKTATVFSADLLPPVSPEPRPEVEPVAAEEPKPAFQNPLAGASFEDLVGGKLPIWIGGIALVFAGFFLVRYTIEAGLLGPGARSILATIFALLLIALAEFGGRLPKVGESFTADPRVGQSLAGAGVATLYGTLYMASEIYGLVGMPTSFLLVIITTAIAFALSLRHGPPTALMGLAGGFAAPWVAGMGAANLPALLLYLAVFIAALFGLAVWRRWLWLLVLASGGGAIWSVAMLLTADSGLPFLGLFILISGAAAVFALDRFGETESRWKEIATYAPMALALVQLAMLLPQMQFSVTAWAFFGALSGLTIALAWREAKMTLVMLAALLLAIAPLTGAWESRGADATTLAATLGIVALFAGAGHWALWRDKQPALLWAIAALGAPIFVWFAASLVSRDALAESVWGASALLIAAVSGWLAWQQHRGQKHSVVMRLATGATVLMLLLAGQALIDSDWTASYCVAIALMTAIWAKITNDRVVRGTIIAPLGIAMVWAIGASHPFLGALVLSVVGDRVYFDQLPEIGDTVRTTLLPALLILALLWQSRFAVGNKTRIVIWTVGSAGVTAFLWLIAKQPAAIATGSDFIRLGFAERGIFTHILFAAGWLALSQSKIRSEWPWLKTIGWALVGIALFRVIWFDLLLLNPLVVQQSVGPVPIANLATGHMALVAIWLWLLARFAPNDAPLKGAQSTLHILSLIAMIITMLVTVRQLMQGSMMSGGAFGTSENYLYSAGLLVLAIAWLARGMVAGSRLMRLAGLGLLTIVTLKVFLIDAAALTGVLRILSFLGLGIALIGIGWAYGRVMGTAKPTIAEPTTGS
jgi:uncharacterized membrane protein